jgi:hypothetical protein
MIVWRASFLPAFDNGLRIFFEIRHRELPRERLLAGELRADEGVSRHFSRRFGCIVNLFRALNCDIIPPGPVVGAYKMKVLTDDPDWARDIYAARALALTVVLRHSRPNPGSRSLHAIGDGFAISYYPNRSPLLLTIDMGAIRVLSIEWKKGDAWRAEIEIYETGPWERRLRIMAHPRPWLEHCRALVSFASALPPAIVRRGG